MDRAPTRLDVGRAAPDAAPAADARPRPAAPPRCRIVPADPERGLSRALLQHLAAEVPEIAFTLDDDGAVDAVWVCGYRPGGATTVRGARARHPDAVIVATGRDPVGGWREEVLAAGADFAISWPVAFEVLQSVLRRSAAGA